MAGVALLVLAIRSDKDKKLKACLILSGAALALMPVFVLMHNLTSAVMSQASVYGITYFQGSTDEGFFFILALVVCPLAYLAGAVTSVYLLVKSGKQG